MTTLATRCERNKAFTLVHLLLVLLITGLLAAIVGPSLTGKLPNAAKQWQIRHLIAMLRQTRVHAATTHENCAVVIRVNKDHTIVQAVALDSENRFQRHLTQPWALPIILTASREKIEAPPLPETLTEDEQTQIVRFSPTGVQHDRVVDVVDPLGDQLGTIYIYYPTGTIRAINTPQDSFIKNEHFTRKITAHWKMESRGVE